MNYALKFISILLLIIFTIFLIAYFHLNKDISTDLKKNKEIIRIHKIALILGDQNTSELIHNFRKDGKITLSEYYKILESNKLYLENPAFDQSISRAAQREREFINRKPLH